MSGHTPGPWLRIDKEDYAEIHAAFRPSSPAVALVGKGEDADLIAAAPELLEALRWLRALWQPGSNHDTQEVQDALTSADAAIQQATKQEQA